MALVAGLFLVNALLPHPQVWALFVLAGAWRSPSSASARPAMSSLTPRLVPDDELAAAIALTSVYSSLAAVAGPAVGGVLISVAGVPVDLRHRLRHLWRLAARALGAAEAAAARGSVDRPSAARRSSTASASSQDSQALIGIFLVDTNAMVFGMPSALFPAIALHRLGGGAATVGYLYAAPYAGALAGSLFSGGSSTCAGRGSASRSRPCVWGAAIAGFGFATSLGSRSCSSRSRGRRLRTARCSARRC